MNDEDILPTLEKPDELSWRIQLQKKPCRFHRLMLRLLLGFTVVEEDYNSTLVTAGNRPAMRG